MRRAVTVVPTVVTVEGRENVVVEDADVIDGRRHEVGNGGHGATVVAYGAEGHLPARLMLAETLETQLIIRLRHQQAVAVGNGVHRGDDPQREITAGDVIAGLDIHVAGETANAIRRVVTRITEDSLQQQGVFNTSRKNNAGHTREYAQQ